jgi:hypothetical protein
MTVFRGDQRDGLRAITRLCNGDTGLGERRTRRGTYDCAGNLERVAGP